MIIKDVSAIWEQNSSYPNDIMFSNSWRTLYIYAITTTKKSISGTLLVLNMNGSESYNGVIPNRRSYSAHNKVTVFSLQCLTRPCNMSHTETDKVAHGMTTCDIVKLLNVLYIVNRTMFIVELTLSKNRKLHFTLTHSIDTYVRRTINNINSIFNYITYSHTVIIYISTYHPGVHKHIILR